MKRETKSKRVFICSPLRPRGDTAEEREKDLLRNRHMASLACEYAADQGYMPLAPHLFFPAFLSDDDPQEREKGIHLGLEWLDDCDELWIIGNRITEGMKQEILHAEQREIPMKHVTFRRKFENEEDQKIMMEENMKKTGETTNTNPVDQLKDSFDGALKELEKALDEGFIESGKVLAQMFRTLCNTALRLPNMSLHTDLMCLTNTDDGLSVYFNRRKADHMDADDWDEDDEDDGDEYDDEEGTLYDED